MKWLNAAPEVQLVLAGVFGLLVFSTALVGLLRWQRPGLELGEVRQRIRTWWIMALIFTTAMIVSRTVSVVLFALVSVFALREFLGLIDRRSGNRRPSPWLFLAVVIQYALVYVEWYGVFIIFIPVFCFLLLPVRRLLAGETEDYLRRSGSVQWGLFITVFCLSHAAFLLILRDKAHPEVLAGPGLMLFLVVLTELNDVAQFLWGRTLGKRKILPAISPGKTWVGCVGGVGTTIALAILLGPLLTPLNTALSAVAGTLIGIGGFLGDINLSALKRDLGIKDTGTLLPGHGGLLDRIDSLTYTAPLFFHYVYYLFDWHTFGATF